MKSRRESEKSKRKRGFKRKGDGNESERNEKKRRLFANLQMPREERQRKGDGKERVRGWTDVD